MKHQRQAGFRDEPGGVHAAGRGRGDARGGVRGDAPRDSGASTPAADPSAGLWGGTRRGGSAAQRPQRGSHARLAQPSVLGPLEPSVGSHLVTPQSPRASPDVGFIYSLPTF